jgi:hypothetical protein
MACCDCLAGQPAFCEIAARLGIAPVVLLARVATMLGALAGDAATLLGDAAPPVASPRKAPDNGAVRTRRWRARRLAAVTGNALAGDAVTARDVTTSPSVTHEANQRVGPSPGVTSPRFCNAIHCEPPPVCFDLSSRIFAFCHMQAGARGSGSG